MNGEEEDKKPAAEAPPTDQEPQMSAEEPFGENQAPAETPPSHDIVEAHEIDMASQEEEEPGEEKRDEEEPAAEPEPISPLVQPAPALQSVPPPQEPLLQEPLRQEPLRQEPPLQEPLLQEPLAAAYAHSFDEPMNDDAFARHAPDNEEATSSLFGALAPDIRFPGEGRARGPRARDAQANLDLDLGRIKRRKRYGLLLTTLGVFFVALVLAPVTWVLAYRFFDPPSTVLMMQRASEGQAIHHAPAPINRISPYIIRSVIAAEDSNFCTHHGFDVNAIEDAMESNAEGGRVRGGSTISQQAAKNLFLWPQRSWVRKAFETYFTALIEFMWPKHRIMEAYLNSAEWGDGNFGIEAAARARFGVSAADLTPLQAARLAAVLPSPNRWRADSPGPYVRRRAASIVDRAQVIRNNHMAACVLAIDAPQ